MPRYTTITTLDDSTKVDIQSAASSAATPLVVDTVNLVRSSNAGADSSQFSIYLSSRRREEERLEAITAKVQAEEEAQALKLKLDQMKKEDEERTKKLAEKRKKRKQRKMKSNSSISNVKSDSFKADSSVSNVNCEPHESSDDEGEENFVLKHKTGK